MALAGAAALLGRGAFTALIIVWANPAKQTNEGKKIMNLPNWMRCTVAKNDQPVAEKMIKAAFTEAASS
ncbi:MAG: hypothetical protein HQM04_18510 [Magnetococcales bacterium]|nr:hypothetical protein [Magnetococcales bacterium]